MPRPVTANETKALGTLILGSDEPGGFSPDERMILQVLARHMSVSLANARMVKRLEELATTDGLTGLYNKRAVTEMARQKLRSAQRFQKPLSVLICDLDFRRGSILTAMGAEVPADVPSLLLGETEDWTQAVYRIGETDLYVMPSEGRQRGSSEA